MDQSNLPPIAPTVRHDGWTPARKARFLDHLAGHGNVRAACACAGMSHEAACRLRRRDALFARAWAAALVHAREASAEVLACRAIDGIEEEVWYRGEVVGTRRRYDSRLLLAHLARLDAAVASGSASEDAARFDELVALAAGAEPSDDVVRGDDGVPLSREASIALAIEAAVELAREDAELDRLERGEPEWEVVGQDEAGGDVVGLCEDEVLSPAERFAAGAAAAACWDAWGGEAHATVDRLLAEAGDLSARTPSTPSTVSTSPLADAAAGGQPGA
jgi:hypothetical protein